MGEYILYFVFGSKMQKEIFDSERYELSVGILDCYILMNFMLVCVTYYYTAIKSEIVQWAWHIAWMDDEKFKEESSWTGMYIAVGEFLEKQSLGRQKMMEG